MLKNNFHYFFIIFFLLILFWIGFEAGFKWSIFLIGLFIVASLPIIFSQTRDPLDDIKIIVEKD